MSTRSVETAERMVFDMSVYLAAIRGGLLTLIRNPFHQGAIPQDSGVLRTGDREDHQRMISTPDSQSPFVVGRHRAASSPSEPCESRRWCRRGGEIRV